MWRICSVSPVKRPRPAAGVNSAMKKFIYSFLRKYIEKNYDCWGIKLEVDLPPEFIITEHADANMKLRFKCKPEKMYKIMLKAWKSEVIMPPAYIGDRTKKHEHGIYKMFNGFVFVFRTRYNKKLGFSQKYLVTVFRKNGFQIYT